MVQLADPSPEALSIEEVCLRTGLSRISLHNYVRRGLIPKPQLCRDRSSTGRYRKRSYFLPSVLDRLNTIQSLKAEGHSLDMIVQRLLLKDQGVEAMPGARLTPVRSAKMVIPASITQIGYPAYMLNRTWDIEWVNEKAEELIFGRAVSKITAIEDRHFFKLLFTSGTRDLVSDFDAFVKSHLALLQDDLPAPPQNPLLVTLGPDTLNWLSRLWPSPGGTKIGAIDQREEAVRFKPATPERYHRVAALFREGTFIVWIPSKVNLSPILDFLTGRQQVISDLLLHKLPALYSMAVLVADLQNSVKISAELPPEEYFQLISELWSRLEEPFREYQGVMGKHVGDGVVRYFLGKQMSTSGHSVNALLCAQGLKECMLNLNASWKAKKHWSNDLLLNIGLHEGREWFGYIPNLPAPEFTALGDTVNIASRLSGFARNGTLWASKHFLSSLPSDVSEHVVYGIRRKTAEGEHWIPKSYSRVVDLLDEDTGRNHKHLDIANVSVAEILQVYSPAVRATMATNDIAGVPFPGGTPRSS